MGEMTRDPNEHEAPARIFDEQPRNRSTYPLTAGSIAEAFRLFEMSEFEADEPRINSRDSEHPEDEGNL